MAKKRTGKPKAQRARYEPKRVDVGQFSTLDDALEKINPGSRYVDIAALLMPLGPNGMPSNLLVMFWMSMITRGESLHQAISRETEQSNPHAVFPLIRAFAEAVVLVMYTLDHPEYVSAVVVTPGQLPKGSPKRKSIKALIDYTLKHFPGMALLYAELSEATHFGAAAMWTSLRMEDREERRWSWSSGPQWRNDEQCLVACAQTLELAGAMDSALRQFAERHVLHLREPT